MPTERELEISQDHAAADKESAVRAAVVEVREHVEVAMGQLDRVITPLEDRVRSLNRSYGAGSPRNEAITTTADTLLHVIRTLRRGSGVGAIIKVNGGLSERESIVELEEVDDSVARAFETIVKPDSSRRFRQSFGQDVILADDVYPTLADNLFLRLGRFNGKNAVYLIAATSEIAAHQRVIPQDPK